MGYSIPVLPSGSAVPHETVEPAAVALPMIRMHPGCSVVAPSFRLPHAGFAADPSYGRRQTPVAEPLGSAQQEVVPELESGTEGYPSYPAKIW